MHIGLGLGLTTIRGGLSPIASLFAAGADGLDFDFSKLDRLYQDDAATTPVSAIDDVIGYARDFGGTAQNGTQGTASFKPKNQADGAKFDGTDDVLVTSYTPAAGANCIVALVKCPAVVSAGQIIAGVTAGGLNFYISVTSAGVLAGGVGSQGTANILSTTDIRGVSAVIGLSCDGSTVKLFADTAEVYSGAQSGAVPTSAGVYVGCRNNGGTAANFYGGHVKRLLVARKHLTLAQFVAIRNQILAGA